MRTPTVVRTGSLRRNLQRLLAGLLSSYALISARADVSAVAYWRLGEDDSGSAASSADAAGTRPLALSGGAVSVAEASFPAAMHAGSSKAMRFPQGAYATAAVIPNLTDNFGIEFWVRPDATNTTQCLAYNGQSSGSGWGIYLVEGRYRGLLGGVALVGSGLATPGVWAHLAFVRQDGVSRLFVNGFALGDSATDAPRPPAGVFRLGANPQEPGQEAFAGLIDEARVFQFSAKAFGTRDLLLRQWAPEVTAGRLAAECHEPFVDPGAQVTMGFTAIAPENASFLALKADGTVVGWGVNLFGEATIPAGATNVAAIAGGMLHSIALKGDGTVIAWGFNDDGEINAPPSATGVVAISAGYYHNLALKADGTVVAWGDNLSGQLNVPPSATGVVAISAGGYHNLALKADGTVIAWGDHLWGQLNVPPSATGVVAIAGGTYHSLALKADGTVMAWGSNDDGESNVPLHLGSVVAIAAGAHYSLALKADGTVIAWGNSIGGIDVPASATGVVAISASGGLSLGLKAEGTILAWGLESFIQTPPAVDLPISVSGAVNTSLPGSYTLAYTAVNALGIQATSQRIVDVVDTKPPTPALNGPETMFVLLNAPFTDPGAIGEDACAGRLAAAIQNKVNPAVPGTYTNTYVVTDPAGNSASVTRRVVVFASPYQPGDLNGDGVVSAEEASAVLAAHFAGRSAVITSPARGAAGVFRIGVTDIPGWSLRVQGSSDLVTWTDLAGPAFPWFEFLDPAAATASKRYYRLK